VTLPNHDLFYSVVWWV